MEQNGRHSPRLEHPAQPPAARRDESGGAPRDAGAPPPGHEGARFADREVVRRVERDEGRTLVEAGTGRRWQVREVDARRVPAAQADRCLIFDAESVVRRLWRYPADWRRMPADELLRLAAS